MKLRSLRSSLVRSLVLLQVLIGMLVIAGFVVYSWAAGEIVDTDGEEAVEIVRQSLVRQADGRLALAATAALSNLRRANPGFWFVASAPGGREELREGRVPAEYEKFAATLDGTRAVLIGEEHWAQMRTLLRFARVDSKAGPVNLLVPAGGPLSPRGIAWGILGAILRFVAPMAVLSGIAVVLIAPWLVRRELQGLVTTASLADRISIHDRSTRLPLEDAAEEAVPLVHAVNRAFDRLNDGYVQQERFLADAAHELRTPITVLQIRLDGLPDDPLKSKLMYDVARLGTLAEQLLDLQRLHRAQASLAAHVDLKELCERIGADLAPLAIQNDCVVSVDVSQPVSTQGDAPSLERAIANLVQNAIEHGGEGCEIVIRAYPPSSIEVSDSGPGIPESQRESVLRPFQRLASRGRGAGLGLYLVTEVVKLHGGRLTIGASELGGARVRMDLNLPA